MKQLDKKPEDKISNAKTKKDPMEGNASYNSLPEEEIKPPTKKPPPSPPKPKKKEEKSNK